MASLKTVISDRRLWLLVLLSALTLALGRFVLPPEMVVTFVKSSGYWFTLALVVAAVAAAVNFWRATHAATWPGWRSIGLWAAIALSLAAWHAHERPRFKILADESVLTATSQNMHLNREPGYGVRATDVRGPFELLQTTLDKRPLLYPFVVSLAHDWTGYRPTNGFWVNWVLGAVFLLVAALLARRIAGPKAAPFAILWLAGIPLLAQQTNGAGFELLNLTLLAAWIWTGMVYASRADRPSQDLFVLVAVLLGSTRYESLLYLAPTALLMIWVWWRRGALLFSPLAWLAPVLLLPTFWLNRTFEHNPAFWELKSLGADKPFGLEYAAKNLGHALAHFLSTDGYQPNSPAFGLLGLLALPVLLIWILRKTRSPQAIEGNDAGLLAAFAGLTGATVVMMLYFWGQFDHPVIHRLSLPTQLMLWLAMLVALKQIAQSKPWIWRGYGVLGALVLVVWSLPTMSRAAYEREYVPGVAHAWRAEFQKRLDTSNVLVIDRDSVFWIIHRISATPIQQANERKEGIQFHFKNQSFEHIFVYQELGVNIDTGETTLLPEYDLSPAYELETVAQTRLAIGRLARMSRVVAIHSEAPDPASTEPATEDAAPPPEETAITFLREPIPTPDNEMDRKKFMEEWLKNLP